MYKSNIKNTIRKKIILLALPLPPPFCGQEKMTEIILNTKITKEFECIHVDTSNRQPTNEDRGAFKWVNIRGTLKITWRIFSTLLRKKVDLVNLPLSCNTLGFLKYAINLMPCILFRVKVVSRLGASHFDKFYQSQPVIYQYFIRKVLGQVDCIIIRGKRQKQQFAGVYDGRIECIYVPSTGIKESAKKKWSLKTKNQINILFLGMVSQAKGAFDLLKAIPCVLAEDKRFRFYFVGDLVSKENNITFLKKEHFDVKNFVDENHLESFVTFCGHLEGEQKENKLKTADLFVFPSYSEGSPFAPIEAMEYGLPVIATRVGNLPELFAHKKNILYVDFDSPVQIKDAILRIAENPKLAQNMINNNFQVIENMLLLEKYEKKMIKIFYSLMQ